MQLNKTYYDTNARLGVGGWLTRVANCVVGVARENSSGTRPRVFPLFAFGVYRSIERIQDPTHPIWTHRRRCRRKRGSVAWSRPSARRGAPVLVRVRAAF